MTGPVRSARQRLEAADRRWRDLPLRTRLTTAAAGAATLAILAVVAVAYVAVRHELRGQIDKQLHHQVHEVQVTQRLGVLGPRVDVNPGTGEIGGYAQLVGASGFPNSGFELPVDARDQRIAQTGSGQHIRDATYDGVHVRMITTTLRGVPNYAVQIALPLTAVDRQLHRLAFAFTVLALLGLGLTALASWGVVRRTMRPVAQLTDAAERIAATRDLTLRIEQSSSDELGRLAATFNTMLDALERSLGAQRQLVMDASHELRTPLASLRTNVEVLNDIDRLTPEQRAAVLTGIVSQLEELTGLVADVVELAKGDAPEDQREDIALDDLVASAVDRARRHWPSVRFDLRTASVHVRGVPGRLDRAVANMLDNAGKFSPPGAEVDVELSPDGELTVADRGPGVPTDALPHVFDRFYRADEARAMPGSGLGLAIVKQVADGHGGTITLANRPDGGAVARLRLPVNGTAAGAPTVPIPAEESLFR